MNLNTERDAAQDRELGAGVVACNVLRRIGLRVAEHLRLAKSVRELGARLHLAQDEVAGSVQNTLDAMALVACQTLLQAGNYRYSTSDGGAIQQLAATAPRQRLQFHTMRSDQFFVRGHDGLPCIESAAHPLAGRIEAARQFDNDVDIGGENLFGVLRPFDWTSKPINPLAGDRPIKDMGQRKLTRLQVAENPHHRAANGAEAEDGHLARRG